jgi:hypothetical protein
MLKAKLSVCAGGLALVLSVMFSGCGSSNSSTTPPPKTTPITVSVSPVAAATGSGGTVAFTATIVGDTSVNWSVNGVAGGNSTVGTIESNGNYTAPTTTTSEAVTVTAASESNSMITATASVNVVATGTVATTNNPQVALYTINPPSSASVYIRFGQDTSYALKTWTRPSPGGGGATSIFVMGMIANTAYHMQAQVLFADGSSYTDPDQVFSTGGLPANVYPGIAVTNPTGKPQPGIEMIDLVNLPNVATPPGIATDLQGNVIWYYQPADGNPAGDQLNPIKQLPDGNFLICYGQSSSAPAYNRTIPPGTINVVREVDPAGNIVRQITVAQLNTALAANGFNLTVDSMHHDVLVLPNGHWILIVNSSQTFDNLTGYNTPVAVLGDQLVDLDTNMNPVWVWNSFDYLDPNRHPFNFPDWTHSNAVLYTADGNLLLSMRHQNWVLKINYANGTGSGNIIWHLGEGGDFTLVGGTDPTDWFYAQHYPSFFRPSALGTSPTTKLGLMDNGDDRIYPTNDTCASVGAPLCPNYSTIPVMTLDETAMTATIDFHDKLALYSFFGGSMQELQNGHIEFDLCALLGTSPPSAMVEEVTQDESQTLIWQMTLTNAYAYRAFRMPSLYPGVQW